MPIPLAALATIGESVGAATSAAEGAGAATGGGSAAAQARGMSQLVNSLKQLGSPLGFVKNQFATLKKVFEPLKPVVQGVELVFDKLTGTFDKLKPVLLETVGLFHPLSVLQFNRALWDLKATFGVVFKPVLQEVTGLIRQFADYLYSMPASFKSVIGSLARTVALAGLVATLGTAFATLGSAMLVVKAIFGPLVWLFESFKRTAGGAGALQSLLKFFEGMGQAIWDAVQRAWDRTAGARAVLSKAFDSLGTSLTKLTGTLSPFGSLLSDLFEVWLYGGLKAAIWYVTGFARGITMLAKAIQWLLGPLSRLLKTLGFELPDMSRPGKSAFGLGWGGATVQSDPNSVYNKLTEEIARNSRPGEPEENPAVSSARHLANIEQLLLNFINGAMATILGGTPLQIAPQTRQALADGIKSALLTALTGRVQ